MPQPPPPPVAIVPTGLEPLTPTDVERDDGVIRTIAGRGAGLLGNAIGGNAGAGIQSAANLVPAGFDVASAFDDDTSDAARVIAGLKGATTAIPGLAGLPGADNVPGLADAASALSGTIPGTSIPVAGAIAALLGAAATGADANNPDQGAALAGINAAAGLGGLALGSTAAAGAGNAAAGAGTGGLLGFYGPALNALTRSIGDMLYEPSRGERERLDVAKYWTTLQRRRGMLDFATTPEELWAVVQEQRRGDIDQLPVTDTVGSLDQLLAKPGSYKGTVQAGINDDYKKPMDQFITQRVQNTAYLIAMAQAGEPKAVAELERRRAAKADAIAKYGVLSALPTAFEDSEGARSTIPGAPRKTELADILAMTASPAGPFAGAVATANAGLVAGGLTPGVNAGRNSVGAKLLDLPSNVLATADPRDIVKAVDKSVLARGTDSEGGVTLTPTPATSAEILAALERERNTRETGAEWVMNPVTGDWGIVDPWANAGTG